MSAYDTRLIRGIGNIAEGKYLCSRVGAEEVDVDEIGLGYFRSARVPWFVKVNFDLKNDKTWYVQTNEAHCPCGIMVFRVG